MPSLESNTYLNGVELGEIVQLEQERKSQDG